MNSELYKAVKNTLVSFDHLEDRGVVLSDEEIEVIIKYYKLGYEVLGRGCNTNLIHVSNFNRTLEFITEKGLFEFIVGRDTLCLTSYYNEYK